MQEVPALASDGDVGNGSDTETDVQEVREVMAMASLDTAEDTVPEVADTESRHTCKTCGKSFDTKKKLYVHNKTHVPKWCSICEKEFNGQNFSRHQVRCRKKNGCNGTSDLSPSIPMEMAGSQEVGAGASEDTSPGAPGTGCGWRVVS